MDARTRLLLLTDPYAGYRRTEAMTLSGNEITDTVRAAGVQGDGVPVPQGTVYVGKAFTNIVTQSIPGALATTGVTKAGDVAATLTLVADTDHPFPNATGEVWCLDNSGGAADATVDFDGNATAAAHVASITARTSAGSPTLSIGGGGTPTTIVGTSWVRYSNARVASAGENLRITAPAGAVVYFVAAQLHTGYVAEPFCLTDGGTAARGAGAMTFPMAGLLTAAKGAWWIAGELRWGISAEPAGGSGFSNLIHWGDHVNNEYTVFYRESSNHWEFKRATYASGGTRPRVLATHVAGDQLSIGAKWIDDTAASAFSMTANGVPWEGYSGGGAAGSVPTISAANLLIGGSTVDSGRQPCFAYRWVATFSEGLLTDADAALFHTWRTTHPRPNQFQGKHLTALWHGNGAANTLQRVS